MPVSLTVISCKGQPYNAGKVVIDRDGGSIGRQAGCSLVLPDEDKIISRKHALIRFENGAYQLEDVSLGGTFVDGSQEPLNNASTLLIDGMLLRIGDYEILVNVSAEAEMETTTEDFAAPDVRADVFAQPDVSPFDSDNDLLNLSGATAEPPSGDYTDNPFIEESDESPLFPEQTDDFSSSFSANENFSSLHDSFIPPEPTGERHANDEMPEDFNFEELFNTEPAEQKIPDESAKIAPVQQENSLLDGSDTRAPGDELLTPVAEQEVYRPAQMPETDTAAIGQPPVSAGEDSLQAFLQGSLLTDFQYQPAKQHDLMLRVGSMFRQFVESTVAVLRSRAEFKSLFRVSVTTIKRTDNNPLKFSVTTDEALKHLLNDGQGGFKDSVAAIDEGFQDILNHQMAMQAGIQASLMDILRQFDPAKIEQQFQEGLVLNKKAKAWDKYCDVYAELADRAVEDFYGDAFAEAYEKQMKQILAVKKNNNQ